jgi:nematocidal protein AidA
MRPKGALEFPKQATLGTAYASAPVLINVLVVIDTEYVKANYPNPSQDPNNPTGIDHNSQFMLCTGSRAPVTGQGTADLGFTANPGDFVSFYGQSIYGNAQDAVIVYGINYWQGATVFNQFSTDAVSITGAAVPGVPNALPAKNIPGNFISLDSRVSGGGKEDFYVYFGLYTLDDTGENQNLFGYYYWDPSITV